MTTHQPRQIAAQPYRLLIADDNVLARASLRSLLEGAPDVTTVGEAQNGAETVRLCLKLRPDIVLLDIRMPDIDGIQVTLTLRKHCPWARVIIISLLDHPFMVVTALRAGIRGYLLKDLQREELLAALRTVITGQLYISPDLISEDMRLRLDDAQFITGMAPIA